MSYPGAISEDDPEFGFKVTLRRPIGLPEPTIETLHFRKPRPVDLVRIGGMPIKRRLSDAYDQFEVIPDRMLNLMMQLCKVPTPALQQMDMMDFAFIADVLQGAFIPVSREGEENFLALAKAAQDNSESSPTSPSV